jgi:hypothetical protein
MAYRPRTVRGRVWPALHLAVLQRLQARGELDWSRAVIDSIQVRARK